MRTAFKPVTNLSCTSAARGDLLLAGTLVAASMPQAFVTMTSFSRVNRRTTSWLWSRPGHAERRHTISRTWSSLVPAAGYILASTLAPCGRASAESALLAAPRMATGGSWPGLFETRSIKACTTIGILFPNPSNQSAGRFAPGLALK